METKPTQKMELPSGFPQALSQSIIAYQGVFDNEMIKSEGGILLPEFTNGAQGDPAKGYGHIMAVGPLVDITVFDPSEGKQRIVRLGDYVQFNHYADAGISYNGKFYLVFHQCELRAYFPEKVLLMTKESIDRRRGAVQAKGGMVN